MRRRAGTIGSIVLAKGKGRRLRPGRLPLLPPVRVVLRRSDGGASFAAAFGAPQRNAVDQLVATSDQRW